MHFHEWKVYISIRSSLKFVLKGPIDNKIVLVQVMAWRRTCDKPLNETMLTQFDNVYMQHCRAGDELNKKLTLWSLNKMITIMQTALNNIYIYFSKWKYYISLKYPLISIPYDMASIKLAPTQVLARRRKSDRPFPEEMVVQLSDV